MKRRAFILALGGAATWPLAARAQQPAGRVYRVRNRLPAASVQRELAEAGFLLTYGIDLRDQFRRSAVFVDKIFKGAKPADLPVEQPTKFEMVINLKTAKALGLDVPPALLARADEVIE